MAQVPKILEDGQSDLLEHVVRVGCANHRRDKGAKGPIVAAKQHLQSVLVAILGEGDEDGFAGILAFGHLYI
jgi:hypothetical protein